MEICIIAAVAADGAIGKDNRLLWHLPGDMKHFREVTMGHPVIMGRKTFESIGRPLPGRRNIIVSRSKEKEIRIPREGKPDLVAETAPHLQAALDAACSVAETVQSGASSATSSAAKTVQAGASTAVRFSGTTVSSAADNALGECFIIGGASLYAETLPLADKLYLTEIQATAPDADTFFPEIDRTVWQETSRSPMHKENDITYTFVTYSRRK